MCNMHYEVLREADLNFSFLVHQPIDFNLLSDIIKANNKEGGNQYGKRV